MAAHLRIPETMETPLLTLLSAIGLFLAASFVFDCIHYLLHRMMNSGSPFLRRIGGLHGAHHQFLGEDMQLNKDFVGSNIGKHVIPEFITQVIVTLAFLLLVSPEPVVIAVAFETIVFMVVMFLKGVDGNHRPLARLLSPAKTFFITPHYHAFHHVFPDSCFSSWTRLFDILFGTAVQIRGKRIAMTGARGSFGKGMKQLLEKLGPKSLVTFQYGKDYTYDDYRKIFSELENVDILILCHGAKTENAMEANNTSCVKIIDRFIQVSKTRLVPPEVWAIGSEIELHPAIFQSEIPYRDSKRRFAKAAARYYRDRKIIYRHIVPASFSSKMGPGLISGLTAARVALFFIKRGYFYIPVTYTGMAVLNYFKFITLSITNPGGNTLSEGEQKPSQIEG